MSTIKLNGAVLEFNSVKITDEPISGAKSLVVNGSVKIGDKIISNYFKSFSLTEEELSKTTLDKIQELGETKAKEDLGI